MLEIVRDGPMLFWDYGNARWQIVRETVWNDGVRTYRLPDEQPARELAAGFLELRHPQPRRG